MGQYMYCINKSFNAEMTGDRVKVATCMYLYKPYWDWCGCPEPSRDPKIRRTVSQKTSYYKSHEAPRFMIWNDTPKEGAYVYRMMNKESFPATFLDDSLSDHMEFVGVLVKDGDKWRVYTNVDWKDMSGMVSCDQVLQYVRERSRGNVQQSY